AHLKACRSELAAAGAVPRAEAAYGAAGGWHALLVAAPVPPGLGVPDLTGCARDCLAVLLAAQQGQRALSADRVWKALKDGEYKIRRRWGKATVKRTLAD